MIDTSKINKLKRELEKKDISIGIKNPDVWISTGNYALNFNLTGNFLRGVPNRRSIMLWGLQGSGKSYIASLIAKNAQDKGYYVVYIDTENAIHEEYLKKIGVDLSEEKFFSVRVSTIEEITEAMSNFFKIFDPDDKVCYVVDSLSMMETEREMESFDKGELQVDMGLFAKRLKLFMKNINNKIGDRDNFFICTNHAYLNQDLKNGKGVAIPSGGEGFQYIPSISVYLSKLKLKEGSDIVGVRISAETTKTRFSQLGRKIQLEVPYDRGIDPLDGLLDLAVDAGLVDNSTKGWYKILGEDGEEIAKFRGKDFNKHYKLVFDFDADENVEPEEMDDDEANEIYSKEE